MTKQQQSVADAIPALGQIDNEDAQWHNRMYEKHPTPFANGVAGIIQRARVRAVCALAKIRPDDTVLEVGCEAGRLMAALPRCRRLVGVDISDRALADARRLLVSRDKEAEWRQVDAENGLPFSKGEFSVIVCSEMLEHVGRPDVVLRNIHALCTPTTRLVITVPIEAPKVRIKSMLHRLRLLNILFPGIEPARSEWHRHEFSGAMLNSLTEPLFHKNDQRIVWYCHIVAHYQTRCD
jgi:2-polyprenyl-3-methyl-5-hydroxy-6-metoxy-1,4-benzoquinol methylase